MGAHKKIGLILLLILTGCGSRKAELTKAEIFSVKEWDYRVQGPGARVYFAAPKTPRPKATPGPVKIVRPASLDEALRDTTIFRYGDNGASMRIRFNERGRFEDAECICPPVETTSVGESEQGEKTKAKEVVSKGRTNIFAILLAAVIGFAAGFYLRGTSLLKVLGGLRD